MLQPWLAAAHPRLRHGEYMRLHLTNDEPVPFASSSRWRATVPLSLFALGAGYVLLVAAPLVSSRFPSLRSDLPSVGSTLPGPVAAGVALLGAAALVLVLAQLVRDVETRPYISIAPVLAVFSGFLLASLRVRLPLEGLASEHAGMFALTLALIGGALVAREPLSARFLGWALVLSAPGLLIYVVALPQGQGDFMNALSRLDPQVRMFLGLLSLSSFALGFVGAVARALARVGGRGEFGLDGSSPDLSVRLPRVGTLPGWQQPATSMTPQGLTYGNLYQSQGGYAGAPISAADVSALRGGGLGRLLLVTALVGAAGFAGVYAWTHRSSVESVAAPTPSAPTPTATTSAAPQPVTTPLTESAPTVAPIAGSNAKANTTSAPAAREPAVARPNDADHSADKQARKEAHEARKAARAEAKAAREAARAEAKAARAEAKAAHADAKAKSAAAEPAEARASGRERNEKAAQAATRSSPTEQEQVSSRANAAAGGVNKAGKSEPEEASASKPDARTAAREQEPAKASSTAKPVAALAAPATSAKPASSKPSDTDDLDQLLDKAVTGTSNIKPKASAKPAAPTQNEQDLDLDDLLKKSLKGGKGGGTKNSGGVQAADDPILGL